MAAQLTAKEINIFGTQWDTLSRVHLRESMLLIRGRDNLPSDSANLLWMYYVAKRLNLPANEENPEGIRNKLADFRGDELIVTEYSKGFPEPTNFQIGLCMGCEDEVGEFIPIECGHQMCLKCSKNRKCSYCGRKIRTTALIEVNIKNSAPFLLKKITQPSTQQQLTERCIPGIPYFYKLPPPLGPEYFTLELGELAAAHRKKDGSDKQEVLEKLGLYSHADDRHLVEHQLEKRIDTKVLEYLNTRVVLADLLNGDQRTRCGNCVMIPANLLAHPCHHAFCNECWTGSNNRCPFDNDDFALRF